MIYTSTKRPRNVNSLRAAAILYGDWGTSKAYVIGLAFALAGYSSFWIMASVAILTALVAVNYIVICKHYPNGGGVYASVRHRSKVLSLVGAFFLIADYLVTAALSALSAFHYIGVHNPEHWAAIAVLIIGLLNYFGPKHTGNLAFLLCIPTVLVVVLLSLVSIPYLDQAVHAIQPIETGPWQTWSYFVGVVLALSGIESVANITGVMKLDPGSTRSKPSVKRTSTPAILWVMFEVCIFTTFLALAMQALPGLEISNGEVNAPGNPGIRDDMLRYMGETFTGGLFGSSLGNIFGVIIGIVFCALLLSAVNTAVLGLISVLFLMSTDKEVPSNFQKLNNFGVPLIPLAIATVIPICLILSISDIAGLADLYAIGFVGAIMTNLGSTSTDPSLPLKRKERIFMFATFLVMLAIEISLFIDKPAARIYVITIIAIGLLLRGFVKEQTQKKKARKELLPPTRPPISQPAMLNKEEIYVQPPAGALMCAVTEIGKTLNYAIDEMMASKKHLFILYIRLQKVISDEDRQRTWEDDEEASIVFSYARGKGDPAYLHFCYSVSDSVADTIVDIGRKLGISKLIIGLPRHPPLISFMRGDVCYDIAKILPADIQLVIIS